MLGDFVPTLLVGLTLWIAVGVTVSLFLLLSVRRHLTRLTKRRRGATRMARAVAAMRSGSSPPDTSTAPSPSPGEVRQSLERLRDVQEPEDKVGLDLDNFRLTRAHRVRAAERQKALLKKVCDRGGPLSAAETREQCLVDDLVALNEATSNGA